MLDQQTLLLLFESFSLTISEILKFRLLSFAFAAVNLFNDSCKGKTQQFSIIIILNKLYSNDKWQVTFLNLMLTTYHSVSILECSCTDPKHALIFDFLIILEHCEPNQRISMGSEHEIFDVLHISN